MRAAGHLLLAVMLGAQVDGAAAALKPRERIVFLGDSITARGVAPKGYVSLIGSALAQRHEAFDIEVFGAGVNGNKVPDLEQRLEHDVLARRPTLVVILIGINDVWHGENNPTKGTSPERYEAGLRRIIRRNQGVGARVVLCTPTVIGEKRAGTNKLDARLDAYAEISRTVATDTGAQLCDVRKAFESHLTKYNVDDREQGILTIDRVHLSDAGNKLLAETILAAIDK